MRRPLRWLLALVAVLALAWAFMATRYDYQVVASPGGVFQYRFDRLTGEVCRHWDGEWIPVDK